MIRHLCETERLCLKVLECRRESLWESFVLFNTQAMAEWKCWEL